LADARDKFGVRSSSGEHQNLKHKINGKHGDLDIPKDKKSSSRPKWNRRKEERNTTPLALIIDGTSLVCILEKELELEVRLSFLI
jgi:phospholipid-transporting ATPase